MNLEALKNIATINLKGWRVEIKPLKLDHAAELYEMANNPKIWKYLSREPLNSLQETEIFIKTALNDRDLKLDQPFVVYYQNRLIATVRYLLIDDYNGSIEIGWLFINPAYHKKYFCEEICYVLINYAFESIQANRVWFKTDNRNLAAKRVLNWMGLIHEGVLRQHLKVRNNFMRDSAVYAFIQSDWQTQKSIFKNKLLSKIF